jgi:hypothetical protein
MRYVAIYCQLLLYQFIKQSQYNVLKSKHNDIYTRNSHVFQKGSFEFVLSKIRTNNIFDNKQASIP